MKLLTRINRNFIYTSAALLTVCSVLLFFMMRYVIYADTDENLLDEKEQITLAFEKTGRLPANLSMKSDRIDVKKMSFVKNGEPVFKDTLIADSLETDVAPGSLDFVLHRQLSFIVSKDTENWRIAISESKLEADDLIKTMLGFIIVFIAALLGFIYFYNRKMSKDIWQPFNETLEKLKQFEITGKNKISFTKSGIDEFDELNSSLNNMTEKIYNDYSRLKQFTENASHEMQTPLAVILNKIELLFQSENFTEEQIASLNKIYASASRLSKLNTALLTLTKIENNQFAAIENIQIVSFIKNKLSELEEIIQQKKITFQLQADENVFVKMNTVLASLLFDNLLSNAIKHNVEEGSININIQQKQFTISNTGLPITTEHEKLFNRFEKNDLSSPSLGLGLAIAKQICINYNFSIAFSSRENIHTICIKF